MELVRWNWQKAEAMAAGRVQEHLVQGRPNVGEDSLIVPMSLGIYHSEYRSQLEEGSNDECV